MNESKKDSNTALLEEWREVLEYIAENKVYEDIPSDEADFSELGSYIFPDRMKKIAEMAKKALEA
jgi:hypothetical protein